MTVSPRTRDIHHVDIGTARLIVAPGGAAAALPETGIGSTERRLDGDDKVTGRAAYAGEEMPPGTLHGVLVTSPVAKGRIVAIGTDAALAADGVVRVIVPDDMPALAAPSVPPVAQSFVPMSDTSIRYEGQPVAIVLAETLEQAEHGAALVDLRIEAETPTVFETAETVTPRTEGNGYILGALDPARGDAEAAMRDAAATVDAVYVAPTRHHNMMEPSATLAEWRGGALHMHDSTQWTYGVRYALSGLLSMEPGDIHVRCPFTGGGFGAKGYVWPHQILAPLAARLAGRPVKIALSRAQCYTGSGYQPVVRSRVALGADADGRLTAIRHDTENVTSTADDYVEFGNAGTRSLYPAPNLSLTTRIRRADVGTPTAMRAPHEGPGMFALESAMDELSYALDMDPLALRLANYAETDPANGKPFSSNRLRDAYAEGARRFGWDARPRRVRARREGPRLIGSGMASAIMSTFRFPASARVCLTRDGAIRVEAGAQEIGTGTRTIFPQIAAERLGIAADGIEMVLGRTDLPETGGTFGSSSTISVGSAVADAADALRARIEGLADGTLPPREAWPALLRENGTGELVGEGGFSLPGDAPFDAHGGAGEHSMHTWGAVFVEMAVDEALGLARMRRCVACYSAGRILNPVTARSQMIGGIIWGYGRAMLEKSAMDPRSARYLSKNLSGVHLPVNADIPQEIDVSFIEEHDPHASAIGVRGIGELGEVGVAAAIANAVYHATGRRVRDLPITFGDLVG